MKNKLVLFDFDGVLQERGTHKFAFEKAKKEAGDKFNNNPKFPPRFLENALCGKYTLKEEMKIISEKYGLNLEYYKKAFFEKYHSFSPDEEMMKYIETVKKVGYTGILTDNTDYFYEYTVPKFELQNKFHFIFNSWGIGHAKLSQKNDIYAFCYGYSVAHVPELTRSDILFIDDKFENLMTAKNYGFDTFNFILGKTHMNKLKNKVRDFLSQNMFTDVEQKK